jgi:hypothetical protein
MFDWDNDEAAEGMAEVDAESGGTKVAVDDAEEDGGGGGVVDRAGNVFLRTGISGVEAADGGRASTTGVAMLAEGGVASRPALGAPGTLNTGLTNAAATLGFAPTSVVVVIVCGLAAFA